MTLDFSTSYRAITDTDINLVMIRDAFGFNGIGAPQAAVTLIGSGGTTVIPASNHWGHVPNWLLAHSPFTDHIELVNFGDKTASAETLTGLRKLTVGACNIANGSNV